MILPEKACGDWEVRKVGGTTMDGFPSLCRALKSNARAVPGDDQTCRAGGSRSQAGQAHWRGPAVTSAMCVKALQGPSMR